MKCCNGYENDQMRALDMHVAYYVQEANREKNKDKTKGLFNKAALLYITAENNDARSSECKPYFLSLIFEIKVLEYFQR